MNRLLLIFFIFFTNELFSQIKDAFIKHNKHSKYDIYIDNYPIRNIKIPGIPKSSHKQSKELKAMGCSGEIRSVSVAISAKQTLDNLIIISSDLLAGNGSVISASDVDIRTVKWWYQGGGNIKTKKKKKYTRELLLKDSRLIKVDKIKKENYIRSNDQNGTIRYFHCSGPTSENLKNIQPTDAATLQSINLDKSAWQEYWINIHIPKNSKSGVYQGRLTVLVDGLDPQVIPLQLEIYPFELLKSPLIHSLYYVARLSRKVRKTVGSNYKSIEQYRAEILNMKEHGVVYPTNYEKYNSHLHKILKIRQEYDLPTDAFFNLGLMTGYANNEKKMAGLQKKIRKWNLLLRRYGYKDIYFYGIDEARGEQLLSQKKIWKEVHKAGGKNFVAIRNNHIDKNINHFGKLLDAPILLGGINITYANKWHKVHSKIFSYSNPQVGEELPEKYRVNYGLRLYKSGYDGVMDYAYQRSFNHIWNDFDHPRFRDHVFAYPTSNGIVDTIAWEGFREGYYDIRYAATLKEAIKNANDRQLALMAELWYESLVLEYTNLDRIRRKMVKWIIFLQNE